MSRLEMEPLACSRSFSQESALMYADRVGPGCQTGPLA